MKNKHIFYDKQGFKIIIEHEKPFSRYSALRKLIKTFKNESSHIPSKKS